MATLMRTARILATNQLKYLSRKPQLVTVNHVYKRSFSRCSALCSGRMYTEKHEWITVEGGVGTIGITNYAQEELGDIVYASMPEEGQELEKDEECGVLESVKAASMLYSPVSGTVTAGNSKVEEEPALINKSCYDEAWLFKIQLSKEEELEELMDEDKYAEFLKGEAEE